MLGDAVCHGCGTGSDHSTPELKPCTLCGEVFYCSKKCQKLGWKTLKHKVHCKGMTVHRTAASAEKVKQETARVAEERAALPAMGAGEHGVYSITCLLDQRLTTLPSLLSRQPATVTEAATSEGGFVLLGLHTCGACPNNTFPTVASVLKTNLEAIRTVHHSYSIFQSCLAGDLTPSMLRVFGKNLDTAPRFLLLLSRQIYPS